jgi:hypothetical protein
MKGMDCPVGQTGQMDLFQTDLFTKYLIYPDFVEYHRSFDKSVSFARHASHYRIGRLFCCPG